MDMHRSTLVYYIYLYYYMVVFENSLAKTSPPKWVSFFFFRVSFARPLLGPFWGIVRAHLPGPPFPGVVWRPPAAPEAPEAKSSPGYRLGIVLGIVWVSFRITDAFGGLPWRAAPSSSYGWGVREAEVEVCPSTKRWPRKELGGGHLGDRLT